MLKKTFCHTQGISNETEKVLWENGIGTWEEFLENFESISCIPQSKLEKIKTEIIFSREHLENNNLKYFQEKLIPKEHHRLANYGKIAYVDIETTGLSKYTDEITMIGIFDGETAKSYVSGQDLEEAYEKLKEFDIIVTFNGKTFDMPFIEYKSKIKYDKIHLDLRFMLKELGLAGGLKKIEIALGITRDDEVQGVDGFEAVRLWRRYKKGDENALRKLLIYNKEDIVNLKFLLEYYLKEKEKTRTPLYNFA
ncbi:MAG: ribonuclease H-like domain-containing protein [Candidatus Woesearchaeota archaeon]|jgi:uncharacterized protein YprB with RNaseH-like and TPR domain|nr:ribonuclease H-like domain-containing protein [Candidatus Woesearchaeota archaeon]